VYGTAPGGGIPGYNIRGYRMAIVAGRVLFCFLLHGRKEISNNNCQGTLEHQAKLGVGTSLQGQTQLPEFTYVCSLSLHV